MPPTALYSATKPCRRCSGDIPLSGHAASDSARLYCDRCRELRRVETFLAQARTIAERLDYDSALAAAIRVASKRAVGS